MDLADLLATAATGQARAALLSADLRRLDRDALTRLAVAGVVVVGLVRPGDEEAERRLRQLEVINVLPSDASPETISAAVVKAVVALTPLPEDLSMLRSDLSDPRATLTPAPPELPAVTEVQAGTGRVVAVWGPTGVPGRTTVAVGLASELAALGWPTLLIDADVYGRVAVQVLGLLDESPGLAAACRLANNGALDVTSLSGLARQVNPALRVLTGIGRADRWPELRPSALEVVLSLATSMAAVTVVDLSFCLQQDEELADDTMALRRNGATLAVLERAETVLAVGTFDPVGL